MYPYDNLTIPGLNSINPGLNSINFQGPYNKMEIPRVSGRDGANSFQLAPNSSVLMIDLTQEDVIWCKSTDSAGFATLKPYRITEIEEPKVVDVKATEESPEYALKSDVDRIEGKIDKLLAELH